MAITGTWRRVVGLGFLATTVILWTVSGFLASSIFADATFSKPYFVIYINTAFFTLLLLPYAARQWYLKHKPARTTPQYAALTGTEDNEYEALIPETHPPESPDHEADLRASTNIEPPNIESTRPLTTRETFNLAFKFAILWFIGNYFNSGSLQYTTVASCTILSTTSSVFTLFLGAYLGVEKFTFKKLVAVVACLLGVVLIARAESEAKEDDHGRGSFPYKTPWQLALGDAMALFAAIVYGVYAVALAKAVGNETRIQMPLFFGFIGLVSIVCLWPGLVVLHLAGIETFEIPRDGHVWMVILVNAAISLVADAFWGYAILFLSPLVVTVGLSLTIPLALVGQIAVASQWVSPLYFAGAVIVVVAFIFINYESGTVLDQPQERIAG